MLIEAAYDCISLSFIIVLLCSCLFLREPSLPHPGRSVKADKELGSGGEGGHRDRTPAC